MAPLIAVRNMVRLRQQRVDESALGSRIVADRHLYGVDQDDVLDVGSPGNGDA